MYTPDYILRLAKWMEDSYDKYLEYLEGCGNVQLLPPDDPSEGVPDRIWASQLGLCREKSAAERLGLVTRNVLSQALRKKFRRANDEALRFREGVLWYAERSREDTFMEVEKRLFDTEVTGKADMVLNLGNELHIPCEIKRTDSYYGITAYQVWQTIGYLKVLNAPFGFVCTLYEDKHRCWPVVRTDGGWYIMDTDGQPARLGDKTIPTRDLFDMSNFFSDAAYQARIIDRMNSYRALQKGGLSAVKAGLEDPYNFQCGTFTAPFVYKRAYKGTAKGETKEGTGLIENPCPLFAWCWKQDLHAKGYEYMPEEIRIVENKDGGYEFADAT